MAASPTARLLAAAHRSAATVTRERAALSSAIDTHRANLAACVSAGVSYSELARQFHTSPARIREQVLAAPKPARTRRAS